MRCHNRKVYWRNDRNNCKLILPMFLLTEKNIFPPVEMADRDGLLAIGGDLKTERLLLAYRKGIFPWFNENEPIGWWSPDPRFVLFPDELKLSKSMKTVMNAGKFTFRHNTAFAVLYHFCKSSIMPESKLTGVHYRLHAFTKFKFIRK